MAYPNRARKPWIRGGELDLSDAAGMSCPYQFLLLGNFRFFRSSRGRHLVFPVRNHVVLFLAKDPNRIDANQNKVDFLLSGRTGEYNSNGKLSSLVSGSFPQNFIAFEFLPWPSKG